MNKKIILVDDHDIIRRGISATLKDDATNEIIGDFSSGEELFDFLKTNSPPDIFILDIVLVGMSGIEIAKKIRQEYPNVKILMLSSKTDEQTIMELLEVGINGFVSKLSSVNIILEAIDSISKNEQFFGKQIEKIICDIHIAKKNNIDNELTSREEKIIRFSSEGLSCKEIATKLEISVRTVETHKSNAYLKLGITNNLDLIKYAIRSGIISL